MCRKMDAMAECELSIVAQHMRVCGNVHDKLQQHGAGVTQRRRGIIHASGKLADQDQQCCRAVIHSAGVRTELIVVSGEMYASRIHLRWALAPDTTEADGIAI